MTSKYIVDVVLVGQASFLTLQPWPPQKLMATNMIMKHVKRVFQVCTKTNGVNRRAKNVPLVHMQMEREQNLKVIAKHVQSILTVSLVQSVVIIPRQVVL